MAPGRHPSHHGPRARSTFDPDPAVRREGLDPRDVRAGDGRLRAARSPVRGPVHRRRQPATAPAPRSINSSPPASCVVHFRRNFGKSSALAWWSERVRGQIVLTLDADLQDDPAMIRLRRPHRGRADLPSGWKQKRHDLLDKATPCPRGSSTAWSAASAASASTTLQLRYKGYRIDSRARAARSTAASTASRPCSPTTRLPRRSSCSTTAPASTASASTASSGCSTVEGTC